jgi:two-component system phosphate regulon response regulator PhoB
MTGSVVEAKKMIHTTAFDLALIDVCLSDGDGFQFCDYIKNDDRLSDLSIIFLTNKGDISSRLLGFSLGADDYISKPFEPLELRARVEAKLKRIKSKNFSIIRKGNIKVNLSYQKAYLVDGALEIDLNLGTNEFRLLCYFLNHENHVLSRRQLLDKVWGDAANVTERTIDTHVYTLRKKLKDHSHYLNSVFGEGYRFAVAPKFSP